MKICSKCKLESPEKDFNYKNTSENLRSSTCKKCSQLAGRAHYMNNRKYYLEKARERNGKLKKENQLFLMEFLSKNPCVDCGEKDPIVLEFDHIRDKSDNVSEMLKLKYSQEKLLEEIMKCEVRCANCHRRKTAKDHHWYKHVNAPVA